MKNYYLKRIDELKTDVGERQTSIRLPRNLSRYFMFRGLDKVFRNNPTKPTTQRKSPKTVQQTPETPAKPVQQTPAKPVQQTPAKERGQEPKKPGISDEEKKAKVAAEKVAAEKKARELESKQAQAALRHRAARLRSSGNAPSENPNIAGPKDRLPEWATYLQIGYILAESLGLL